MVDLAPNPLQPALIPSLPLSKNHAGAFCHNLNRDIAVVHSPICLAANVSPAVVSFTSVSGAAAAAAVVAGALAPLEQPITIVETMLRR